VQDQLKELNATLSQSNEILRLRQVELEGKVQALKSENDRLTRQFRELSKSTAPDNSDLDDDDVVTGIERWMGQRPSGDNHDVIRFDEVDAELGLQPGVSRRCLANAAARWKYQVQRITETTITLRDRSGSVL
ncbi:MAG: hypothetical protein AAFY46_02980, partial [Planctomycetota bacterium]